MRQHGAHTIALHSGQIPDPATGALGVPIHQCAGFVFGGADAAADLFDMRTTGYVYSRISNPTVAVLEQRIADLESGAAACAFATGQAAVASSVMALCGAGDNLVVASALFGGTYTFMAHTLRQFGIEARFVDPDAPERVAELVDRRTQLVFAESVGNPRLNVLDVPAWARASHAAGLPLVVDNTGPTPILCRVLDHGADVAVHSATKYLGGHGSTLGGLVVDAGRFDWAADPVRYERLNQPDPCYHDVHWTERRGLLAYIGRVRSVCLRSLGATLAPHSAYLLLQGVETLPLRMARHSENALALARHLEQHPAVAWVNYPGLDSSPYHDRARELCPRGAGGILTLGLVGGEQAGRDFIDGLEVISHAANVGDAKSLVIHPASTIHSELDEDERHAAGVSDDLVRISVGLEDVEDLIADVDAALAAAEARNVALDGHAL